MALEQFVTGLAGIGAVLTAGFYFALAVVVMLVLRRRLDHEVAEVMMHTDHAAVRAPFLLLFFGMAAAASPLQLWPSSGHPWGGRHGSSQRLPTWAVGYSRRR